MVYKGYCINIDLPYCFDSKIFCSQGSWQFWLPPFKGITVFCRSRWRCDFWTTKLSDTRYFTTTTRVKSNCTIPRLSLLGFRPVYTVRATFIAYGVLSISSPYRLGSFAPTCFTLFVCRHTNANGKWSTLLWTCWLPVQIIGFTHPNYIGPQTFHTNHPFFWWP